ncbi:MAG TPA: hypothetical protein VG708_09525 [Mycobacteriales bacterium]|nr:hypothetical protein [Mycobacteriales bacterium]
MAPANASRPTHHTPGYVLTDHGLVTRLGDGTEVWGDFAIDPHGGEHVLTARFIAGKRNDDLRYYSRHAHDKHFSEQQLSLPIGRTYPVETLISVNGKHVFTVFDTRTGVWTAQTPIGSHHLPRPRLAARCTKTDCGAEVPFAVAGAIALPRNRLAILARVGDGSPMQLYVGTPGRAFSRSHQSAELDPYLSDAIFRRDPVTGEELIVGEHIGVPDTAVVVSRQPGGHWSSPRQIATLPFGVGAESYRIADAAASDGRVVVALAQNDVPANPAYAPIELVTRTKAGTWSPPTRPAHVTVHDVEPHVALSHSGGRLVLAFDRRLGGRGSRGTIRSESLHGGSWSRLTTLTPHPTHEVISALALAKHNRPVVAFSRYRNGAEED